MKIVILTIGAVLLGITSIVAAFPAPENGQLSDKFVVAKNGEHIRLVITGECLSLF
jgi:hypothetical protein